MAYSYRKQSGNYSGLRPLQWQVNSSLARNARPDRAGTNLDSCAYGYNAASQRTNVVWAAGDYVRYSYDAIGELTTARGYDPG
ncbi:MAG TPA: hypothetical protein VFB55_04870, partial [Verrucomicrobiae bacterium]|nr:hypothetical protein [Verrucomicrobiae bacterium]